MQLDVDQHTSPPCEQHGIDGDCVRTTHASEDGFARVKAIAERWLPVDRCIQRVRGADGSERVANREDARLDGASGIDVDANARVLIETHWTRVLHHDMLGTAPDMQNSECRPSFGAGRASPSPDFRDTYWGQSRAARRRGERVTLTADDGYRLAATHFSPAGPVRAHLVVAGGIGVPQRYYARFAEFAASAGYSTMTLDYRGVGLSATGDLRDFRMEYFDWSRRDLAAAIAAMCGRDVPLYVVGHSFGGHAFGLLPNCDRVAAFYTFGTGAGWHGWMPVAERFKVLFMWNVLGPLLTRWKGYLAWSLLGMGEDLPLDFYERWKHWCRFPNYFFGDALMAHLVRAFDRVRAPVMAANAIDDRWAPPKSRDAFMAGYRNAARQTLDIDPARIGLRSIGHMGYFRLDAMPLWTSALAWLDAHARGRAVAGPRGPLATSYAANA